MILYSTEVKLVKSLAAMTFVRLRYSKDFLMKPLKEIAQKRQMRPLGADFSLKKSMKLFKVSVTKLHHEQGS